MQLEATAPRGLSCCGAEHSKMIVEAVLWDLDATIIDTESLLDESIRSALQSLASGKLEPEAVDRALKLSRGCSDKGPMSWPVVVLRELGLSSAITTDQLHDTTYEVFDRLLPSTKMMPGATRAVTTASAKIPHQHAIVTSGTRAATETKRQLFPSIFQHMSAVVAVDDVTPCAKPHGLPYLLAAIHLGVDPAQCIVVEDSIPGITAGRAAGAYVIAVPQEHHREEAARLIGSRGVVLSSLEDFPWDTLEAKAPSGLQWLADRAEVAWPAALPESTVAYLKKQGALSQLNALEKAVTSSGAVPAIE